MRVGATQKVFKLFLYSCFYVSVEISTHVAVVNIFHILLLRVGLS